MIRSRFTIYWIVFLLSSLSLAIVAGLFVYKELVRFREQAEMSVTAQLVQTEAQLASLVDEIKTEATRQLVSFHTEGLEFQLTKWGNENPLIQDTFIWREAYGFQGLSEASISEIEELPWQRAWNGEEELFSKDALIGSGILSIDPVFTRVSATGENYGYLNENLEILQYKGVKTNPYVGWMSVDLDDQRQWIFWHQLAKGEEVRGFFLNLAYLSDQATGVVTSFVASDIDVDFAFDPLSGTLGRYAQLSELGDEFPAWYLLVQLSKEAASQESIILLSGGLVLGLFLVLIAGGSVVIHKAHTDHQDILQKTTFVSAVSHELKTPLTSIRMYSELLDSENLEPQKRAQYTDTISRESQRLTSLINNLLTHSSIEHGKRKYRYMEFDLVSMISTTLKDYEKAIQFAGVDCEVDMPQELIQVKFDESVLKMVLVNLIENVLKHACDGGWIQIAAREEAGIVFLEVADKGTGIPDENRKLIFDPFFQGESLMKNKKPGTGLGLSIARSMMLDCGGSLELVDSANKGATFRITFRNRA